MSARSKARKRALDLIYASEMRNRSAVEALEEHVASGPVNDYTVTWSTASPTTGRGSTR